MQKAKYFSLDMPRHGTPIRAHTPTEALFARACAAIPGGVNSPVRAYQAVGTTPRFIRRAHGAYVWDTEGKRYVDYVGSWGPAILGHAHPEVVRAVQQATLDGLSFGAPTEAEVQLAETLGKRLPSLEQVRLVSSGTEATMSAIRLARGFTGRTQVIKFEGCYHGHADSLLVQAGSGLLTLGTPDSAGVPRAFVEHTVVLPYNDLDAVRQVFARQGPEIAGVIVEPVAGNMNLVCPAPGFLQGLRELCTQHGAVLIFDEVMTGFRVGPQGAQGLFGIMPDLTTLGKVIGGGMPLAAYGGRRDIMAKVSPLGPVYQAGTLAGNPVAVAAGLATLSLITEPGFHSRLASRTQRLVAGLRQEAERAGVTFTADAVGGMFGMYFQRDVPGCLAQARQADTAAFAAFFRACLAEGVYFAPSAFEAGFVSMAHDDALVDQTVNVAGRAFQALAAQSSASDAVWTDRRERA